MSLKKIRENVGSSALPIVGKAAAIRIASKNPNLSGMTSENDPYYVLGLERDASPSQIRQAYRTLSPINHPDGGGNNEHMKDINSAHEILEDETKRRTYDRFSRQSFRGVHASLAGNAVDWENPDRFLSRTGYCALADLSKVPLSVMRIMAFLNWLKDDQKTLPKSLIKVSQLAENILTYLGYEALHDRFKYRQEDDDISEALIFVPQIASTLLSDFGLNIMSIDQYTGRPKYDTRTDRAKSIIGATIYIAAQVGNMIPWYLIAEGSNLAHNQSYDDIVGRNYSSRITPLLTSGVQA